MPPRRKLRRKLRRKPPRRKRRRSKRRRSRKMMKMKRSLPRRRRMFLISSPPLLSMSIAINVSTSLRLALPLTWRTYSRKSMLMVGLFGSSDTIRLKVKVLCSSEQETQWTDSSREPTLPSRNIPSPSTESMEITITSTLLEPGSGEELKSPSKWYFI